MSINSEVSQIKVKGEWIAQTIDEAMKLHPERLPEM
ncbi:hypothetical protein ABIC60_004494 [Phyllobacterium ifriqiyense]